MPERMQGYVYLALAMALVGSTVVASKLIAAGLPPFAATALRFTLAFPIFMALMRVTGTAWPRLSRRDWGLVLAQAIAGSVGYTTLLICGLRLTSAADAGVIVGTLPVVSAAFALFVLGERPHRFLLLAVALAAAGVLSIALRPQAGDGHSLAGNGLIAGAVICESLFILLNKRLDARVPPLALSALMSGIGGVAALPLALLEAPWAMPFDATALWAVAYYALVPTVVGFVLWYAGAEKVSGTEAALFNALAPVSAVLLAAGWLGEPVGVNQMVGVGCVLAAVASLGMVGRSRRLQNM
ncbi:membrane protein [Pandoraea thiooxydans]|uniref:EamA domain-containing protein n=1 Tax=Pandoraea thiooxydans TaxID=445709 RepID=A0A0G3EJJ3_9BURK|nr:DMT family transporter [Pandoraea thiooxydans]AKJ67100.1 hypothetical protein ABW99_01515 [Pandoraea thiooxydans]APR94050.1 membrane protein [Pandoraea thiooxydans]